MTAFRLKISALLVLGVVSFLLLRSGFDVGASIERLFRGGAEESSLAVEVEEECDSCTARHKSLQKLQELRAGDDAEQ